MANNDEPNEEAAAPSADRRTVLFGAGALGASVAGVGVVGLLAACSTKDQAASQTNGSTTSSGTTAGATSAGATGSVTSAPPSTPEVIKTADVPVGGGVVYPNAKVVITQPTAGTFKAFDAACTHMGCQVVGVSDGKIRCACHGSQFAIADGSVARGPATASLAAKPVTVKDGVITVG